MPLDVSDRRPRAERTRTGFAVTERSKTDYLDHHPARRRVPACGRSLRYDSQIGLDRKAALYAKAGVREYWVLDLNRRASSSIAIRDDGAYQSVQFSVKVNSSRSKTARKSSASTEFLPPTAPDTAQ